MTIIIPFYIVNTPAFLVIDRKAGEGSSGQSRPMNSDQVHPLTMATAL